MRRSWRGVRSARVRSELGKGGDFVVDVDLAAEGSEVVRRGRR